tara:strand:+ start:3149 stop:4114 length:966 start_codon:yes stop_codon:yes gene_type:complete
MFTIKRHSKKNYAVWDCFVKKANNGTIFHLRKFLSYHPDGRFNDHSIEFYKNNTLVSVFPAAESIINGKRFLVSHPGATVGSFVTPENLSISNSIKLVKTLVHYAKKNKFDGIRLTLPPLFYHNRASNYLDYSLLNNGFEYHKREVTSTLFIEQNENSILKKFRPSHGRAVRRAEKLGVEAKRTNQIENFFSILKQNLKIRHGVKPTHTLDEIYNLIEIFPQSVNLFGAFYKEQMIAGVLNFIVKDDVALAFYISHKEEFQELRPLNLLFYSIFKWAIKENIKVYDFGIFTEQGEANMGLGRFKENFGASGIFRDTLEINF